MNDQENGELFLQEVFEEEVLTFLAICGKKDREFLEIPETDRKIEDYARLLYITKILGFKKVFLRIAAETENRIEETCNYIVKAKQDVLTINKWMENFIENVPLPEIRQILIEIWDKKKQNTKMKTLI